MADDDKPDAPDDKLDDDNKRPDDAQPDKGGNGEAKWKALARKHEKEAKANAAKLKEYEDREKTDTQKLTERAETAEGNLSAAELKALRLEVALDKGLPKSLAVRLQGSTVEELEADADELVETLGDGGNGRKTPSFDGGPKDQGAPKGGSFLTDALTNRRR
jgi:3-oxoacyl-[acyl-carrier-protein] synthase III